MNAMVMVVQMRVLVAVRDVRAIHLVSLVVVARVMDTDVRLPVHVPVMDAHKTFAVFPVGAMHESVFTALTGNIA